MRGPPGRSGLAGDPGRPGHRRGVPQFKRLLPPRLLAELIGQEPAITFVTQAELTKWAVRRQWGTLRQERMARWLTGIPVLHSSDDIAAVWGEIAASAERRGRPRPQNDTWVAACCLAYELPLATLNVKDFRDFAEHDGLVLITG